MQKKTYHYKKCQTSTELIVLISAIIIICLILIAAVSGIPKVARDQKSLFAVSKSVGQDLEVVGAAYDDTNTLVTIKNNYPFPVFLEEVEFNDVISISRLPLRPGKNVSVLFSSVIESGPLRISYSAYSPYRLRNFSFGEVQSRESEELPDVFVLDTTAMVAYFPFDDFDGSRINDFTATQAQGVAYSSPQIAPGVLGDALYVPGDRDRVQVTSSSSLNLSIKRNLTVLFWSKSSDASGTNNILQKYRSWGFTYPSNAMINGSIYNGTSTVGFGTNSAATSRSDFVQYAMTISTVGTNSTMRMYHDGTLKNTVSRINYVFGSSADPLVIGNWNNTYDLNGQIDELMIWDRPLSLSELNYIRELIAD